LRSAAVNGGQQGSVDIVLVDEGVKVTGESVNILHHAGRAVNDGKKVTQELLSPTVDNVDGARVVQNFFDSTAVTDPVELSAPKVLLILGDGPTSASGLTNKGIEMTLLLSAFARVKADELEAGTALGEVEGADTVFFELLGGSNGSRAVIGLHENRAKTIGAPIGLQESGFGVVVTGEAGAGSNVKLNFLKKRAKGRGPSVGRNRFLMVKLDEFAEGFQFDLEPGAVLIIKVTKLDERVKSLNWRAVANP
jgi:hypothetical protein